MSRDEKSWNLVAVLSMHSVTVSKASRSGGSAEMARGVIRSRRAVSVPRRVRAWAAAGMSLRRRGWRGLAET